MAEYTRGHRLHMGYSFELLSSDFSAAYIRDTVEQLEAQMQRRLAVLGHFQSRRGTRAHAAGATATHRRGWPIC